MKISLCAMIIIMGTLLNGMSGEHERRDYLGLANVNIEMGKKDLALLQQLVSDGTASVEHMQKMMCTSFSPVELATYFQESDLARKLIEKGASLGNSLHYAALWDNCELVNILCVLGADPALLGAGVFAGKTPLHCAVSYNSKLVIPTLIKRNPACLSLSDAKGRTPLVMAIDEAYGGLVFVLCDLGADVREALKLVEEKVKSIRQEGLSSVQENRIAWTLIQAYENIARGLLVRLMH